MASSDYERAGATPDRHNYLPLLAINETELVNSLLSKGEKMPSGSSSKSLIIKPPEFCSLMKPGNAGVAEATARLLGCISGQKGKAWVVKDLGLEPLTSAEGLITIALKIRPSQMQPVLRLLRSNN